MALHAPGTAADDTVPAFADRLARLADQAGVSGADVILITPGPDLEYFIGHSVASHERLTCLVVPAGGEPSLLVPTLERPGWAGTPVEDPGHRDQHLDRRRGPLPGAGRPAARRTRRVLAVDYHMPAVHALNAQAIVPGSELTLAGEAIAELRMRKGAGRGRALAAAGRGHRPGAAPDRRVADGRPDRERGRRRHRQGHRRRGTCPAGFRHRRVRSERGQPAPRGLGPGDRAG